MNKEKRGVKKRLAAALGYTDHTKFSHNLKNKNADPTVGNLGMRFSIEEFGIMANELDAPPGWPFVDWATGEALRGVKALIAASKEDK